MMKRMTAVTEMILVPVETNDIFFNEQEGSELGKVNRCFNIPDCVVVKGKVAMVRQKTSFELTTQFQTVALSPNLLSCQLADPSSQPVECTTAPTQQPGSCTFQYIPTVRGPHHLSVTLGGIVPISPVTISVFPSPEMRDHPLDTITGVASPYGVAVSKTGEVLVSELNLNRITVFDREFKNPKLFGSKGSGKGQFDRLRGIAFSQDGHLLVADGDNHRIQSFTLEGEPLECVGEKGNGELQFKKPCGIAVHPSGKVFIADTKNHRIQVLYNDLDYSHKFGSKGSGHGKFYSPMDVAFDSQGNVYVADRGNNCVQKLTSHGNFISSFGREGSEEGQLDEPVAICIDPTDMVYVSEKGNNRVSVFDTSGNFLKFLCIGERGILEPRGIAVDPGTGNLFVCGHHSRCVFIY